MYFLCCLGGRKTCLKLWDTNHRLSIRAFDSENVFVDIVDVTCLQILSFSEINL
jgi:hypothetical protein